MVLVFKQKWPERKKSKFFKVRLTPNQAHPYMIGKFVVCCGLPAGTFYYVAFRVVMRKKVCFKNSFHADTSCVFLGGCIFLGLNMRP